jgi:hypothetical protein
MEQVTSTEHKMTESKYKCGHCGIDARMFIVCESEHTIIDNDSGGHVWFTDFYQLLLCPSCNSINAIKQATIMKLHQLTKKVTMTLWLNIFSLALNLETSKTYPAVWKRLTRAQLN